MKGKLSVNQRKQLEKWIGMGPMGFDLLYSITADGCSAPTFHTKCDNKGATVTVLYNGNQSIYGGYTQQSWNSTGAYMEDSTAFLFRLQYNGTQAYDKFPCKAAANGAYGHPNYGPTFGAGHDMKTFKGSVVQTANYFNLNGQCSFGSTFDMKGMVAGQITNDSLVVTELEVYQVKDQPLLVEPWRRDLDWTAEVLERLQNDMENYKPPKVDGVPQAKILLLGPVGAGKSSFFNTISSVFRGHVSRQASRGSAEHSITAKFRQYQVRTTPTSEPLKFRLCDTRGLEETQGIDANELATILDGHMPNGYCFNAAMPITPEAPGYIKTPTFAEKVHCVCFIMDGTTISAQSPKMMEKIKAMQAKINLRGIPHLLLLTKTDKVCSGVEEKVSNVYKSSVIKELVDTAADIFGLARSDVLPVKNYEKEVDLADDVSLLALETLNQMLRAADDFFCEHIDQMDQPRGIVNAAKV